jgi:HSP20 family protein
MPTSDIVRRDPVFNTVRQAMDRFFDEPFFREAMANPFRAISDEGTLPLDVYEKDGKIVVEASLPGFQKDEIDVQVHEGVLYIKAQRSSEHEESGDVNGNGGRYFRRERTWGSLSRRVALPATVDEKAVEAELKNGVLTLRIPLPEQTRPKQIEIKD